MTIIAALLLSSCDAFSIRSVLTLPGALKIRAESSTVERGGDSTALIVTGGSEVYVDYTLEAVSVYSGMSETAIGQINAGAADYVYQPGTSIGQVKITVKDSLGAIASCYVTIGPATPSLAIPSRWPTSTAGEDGVDVRWDYSPVYSDLSFVEYFQIQMCADGEYKFETKISYFPADDYSDLQAAGTTPFTTITGLDSTLGYTFRLYAVSVSGDNTYRSLASDISSAATSP